MTEPTAAPAVPFWESKVFLAGLAALIAQVADLVLNAPMDVLMSAFTGDGAAIRKLVAIVFTGLVLWLRSVSKMQPLTMGVGSGDQGAAAKCCILATALLAMITVSGCQTLKNNQASVQLVTQYAVAKYLEGKKTDLTRYEAASRIVKIASDLKSATAGQEVSLFNLRAMVTGALAAQPLSPADRILANGLAEILLSELESRFRSSAHGFLDQDQLLLVNDVLTWITNVAMTIPDPRLERPQ